MINLLPRQAQKQLEREYVYRVLIIIAIMIALATIIFSIILGTLYFVLNLERGQLEKLHTDNLASPEVQNDIANINDLQNKMNILSFNTSGTITEQFSELIRVVIEAKNKDIHIKEITIQNNETLVISVSGIADTRDGFVKYLESLKTNKLFSSVNSPVSNLSQSTGISFSINIEVVTQKHEK